MKMLGVKARRMILISTGGTIEKTYDESDGSLENRGTVMEQKLRARLRLPYTNIEVLPVLSKDSLHMTDADRVSIWQAIQDAMPRVDGIVVLHGTDTMTVTARFCWERCKDPKIPVVFTGAMRPLGFEDSDALQNVTEAMMAAKIILPGFYLSFHNQLFTIPKVRKNRELMTFEWDENG